MHGILEPCSLKYHFLNGLHSNENLNSSTESSNVIRRIKPNNDLPK